MKISFRFLGAVLCAAMILCLCACGGGAELAAPDEADAETGAPSTESRQSATSAPTEAPDLTSKHGYFDPDDNGQLFFRGQAYYKVYVLSGYSQLILDIPMSGVAYITQSDVTDDKQARQEGAAIYFDASKDIPDLLMMTVDDYFTVRGENYDPDMYPQYQYYCKREEMEVRFAKLRTTVFNNMYITQYEKGDSDSLLKSVFSLGEHEMLDEDTTAAIRSTAKDKEAGSIAFDALDSERYTMLCVHRCDKNMLIDPMTDEYYLIRTDDGRCYVGDWYSNGFVRASEEHETLIGALIDKYPDTAAMHTEWFIEALKNQGAPDDRA